MKLLRKILTFIHILRLNFSILKIMPLRLSVKTLDFDSREIRSIRIEATIKF